MLLPRQGFDVKTTSLPRVTGLVSIGNICVTCHKSPPNHGTAEFDKLLLETEPVAHGNNVVLTSKLVPKIPSCLTQLIIMVIFIRQFYNNYRKAKTSLRSWWDFAAACSAAACFGLSGRMLWSWQRPHALVLVLAARGLVRSRFRAR